MEPIFFKEKQKIAEILENQMLQSMGIFHYDREEFTKAQESENQMICHLSFDYSEYDEMLAWIKEYLMMKSLSYFLIKLHSSYSCPFDVNDLSRLGDAINIATPTQGKGSGYAVLPDMKKEMEIYLFMVEETKN